MLYAVKDEDLVVPVDFTVNGNFVYPDNNSYSYKLRNRDGSIIMEGEGSTTPPSDLESNSENELIPSDRADILIAKQYNSLDEETLFKTQILEVKFLYEKRPYTITISYRITPYFYFDACPQDVRNYYGLNIGELPDEDIDLKEIYLQLVKRLGTTFTDCLNSNGVGNIRANRLITLHGVVQVFSSVKLRVNQEENDGSSKFLRYLNKINWDDLLEGAQSEIEELEKNLSGEVVTNFGTFTPIFLGTVEDAITGEG